MEGSVDRQRAFGTPASAQSSAGEWRQTVFLYGMGATIDCDSQILDEWGETLTNIHERNYPLQPYGKFACVASASTAPGPAARAGKHCERLKK